MALLYAPSKPLADKRLADNERIMLVIGAGGPRNLNYIGTARYNQPSYCFGRR
ncbi:hypothetical protein SAMN04487768_2285 [Burkholderia sp. b13]|nr:hypothetical protein SAMN04487768_2285 [Burkholderia sp. b13]